MPAMQPLFLPKVIVEENCLVLDNDFEVEPRNFSFDAAGRLYVLSHLFYNYFRYDKANDAAFSTWIVNVYDPEFSHERIADFSELHRTESGGGGITDAYEMDLIHPHLVVTPGGCVVITTDANRAFLFDATLENRLGKFAAPDSKDMQRVLDDGFASAIEPTADGRLLCVVDGRVCVSDGSDLTPNHRPALACIAFVHTSSTLEPNVARIRTAVRAPQELGDGAPVGLVEQTEARFGLNLSWGWSAQTLPLDGERFAISLFHKYMRGGSKGLDFAFAIASHDGRIVGRLEGIDTREESPFVDHHVRFAVDRVHQRIVYKNKTSCFLFDYAGQLLEHVRLDDDLRTLAPMKLATCSPDGRILFYHPKQHFLLATDAFAEATGLRAALASAAAFVKTEKTRLKKGFESTNSRWIHSGAVVRQ